MSLHIKRGYTDGGGGMMSPRLTLCHRRIMPKAGPRSTQPSARCPPHPVESSRVESSRVESSRVQSSLCVSALPPHAAVCTLQLDAGLRVEGLRVEGLRVEGLRVEGRGLQAARWRAWGRGAWGDDAWDAGRALEGVGRWAAVTKGKLDRVALRERVLDLIEMRIDCMLPPPSIVDEALHERSDARELSLGVGRPSAAPCMWVGWHV